MKKCNICSSKENYAYRVKKNYIKFKVEGYLMK